MPFLILKNINMTLLKKLIPFYFAVLFCGNVVWAQCPQGNIKLETQAQVDSFPILYPACTEIVDDLTIGKTNSDITDLSSLSQITAIRNDLTIYGNDSLISLSGLENITSIGMELSIRLNYSLASLNSLENITSLNELSININNSLTDLSGLDNLTSVEGDLSITFNDALSNLNGLGSD